MPVSPLASRPALTAEEASDYLVFRTEQIGRFERLAGVAGAISVLAFIWWDAQMSYGSASETLAIRLGFAGLLLILFGVTFTRLARYHHLLQVTSTAVIIGGLSLVLTRIPEGFSVGLAGLVLSVALLPMVAPSFGIMLALCGVAVVIPNLFLVSAATQRIVYINVNLWMLLAAALATAFWWVFDGVNRQLFLSERHLADERRRADRLLENILPTSIAAKLKGSHESVAERYEAVTVLFADIVGFTAFAQDLEPGVVVDLLNQLFSRFDDVVEELGLEKIKTLGDGYMAAGGVPQIRADHAEAVADLALQMVDATQSFAAELEIAWDIRIGVHSGPVVAGVIGKRKFAYDLWGDAVNVASRLESTSEAGRIQLSEATAELLPARFLLEPRGSISLKNHGDATTFFLVGNDGPRSPIDAHKVGVAPRPD